MSVRLLEDLARIQLYNLLWLLTILFWNRGEELRWRDCGLTKALKRRWALVASAAYNNIAISAFPGFLIYNLSHILTWVSYIFPQELFKWRKKNLLWVLFVEPIDVFEA